MNDFDRLYYSLDCINLRINALEDRLRKVEEKIARYDKAGSIVNLVNKMIDLEGKP